MSLYYDLMMTYTRGRNLLPDNKHLQKTELGVTENIDIHVGVTLTRMFRIRGI